MSRHIQGAARLEEEHELYRREKKNNKILILRNNGILYSFLLCNGRIRKVEREEKEDFPIGSIILGKVSNVAKQFGGVFFSLGARKEQTGFLQAKDSAFYQPVNRKADGRILCGDEIPVQVIRQAKGTKPPRLSTEYTLSGQTVVVKKGSGKAAYSAKCSEEDRLRLKEAYERWKERLMREESETAPCFSDVDIMFRTNAPFTKEGYWQKELIDLISQLNSIDRISQNRTAYSRLYEPEAFYLDFIKEQPVCFLEEIVTDEKDVFDKLAAHPYTASVSVRFYEDKRISLQSVYALTTRLSELLSPKVYMKSGAYLVIEPTEALVAVDVNTGKSEKKKEPEDFYFQINLEAAKEVCYQLSARNLSGMILIDFINMKEKGHTEELIKTLKEETRKDTVPTRFIDMTKLGIAELTRKKTSRTLQYIAREWKA